MFIAMNMDNDKRNARSTVPFTRASRTSAITLLIFAAGVLVASVIEAASSLASLAEGLILTEVPMDPEAVQSLQTTAAQDLSIWLYAQESSWWEPGFLAGMNFLPATAGVCLIVAVRFTTLDAICEALDCQPGDLTIRE